MQIDPKHYALIERECAGVLEQLQALWLDLAMRLAGGLQSARAKEYLQHGVSRRIKIIRRCIENIYAIYPLQRSKLLSTEELSDVQINLHAFVINLYGIFDNIAWVYVIEKDLLNKIDGGRTGVGLFNRKTQKHLPQVVRKHLNSHKMNSWYKDYAKNYRDALAHRIPLYVPPCTMTKSDEKRYEDLEAQLQSLLATRDFDRMEVLQGEQRQIGTICGAFLHSYSDFDAAKPILFHAQILADAKTVIETIGIVAKHF